MEILTFRKEQLNTLYSFQISKDRRERIAKTIKIKDTHIKSHTHIKCLDLDTRSRTKHLIRMQMKTSPNWDRVYPENF